MQRAYMAAYPELYRRHWWWRSRERVLLSVIGRLVSGMPSARILDVGCGAGLFFDALSGLGHVEGVESDALAVGQSGRWRGRITLGELSTTGDPADVLLLLDVIEHLTDPQPLLKTAAARLSSRGRMVVTVPAFQWLWTSHDVLNEHARRYTSAGLRGELQAAGLEVIETRYLFPSMVVPKALVALLERVTSKTPRVPTIPAAPINAGAQAWFRVEHALFGWLPFGGSVLAIARRAG